jgi:DNA-binding HxlR family transcriptional regulator
VTWLILIAAVALLVTWLSWKDRRRKREELCNGLLRSMLYRGPAHPRDLAMGELTVKLIKRRLARLVRQGLLHVEQVESAGHYWGPLRQDYYGLTEAGRERAIELANESWREESD